MKIIKSINNNVLNLTIIGQIDTLTSPELQEEIDKEINNSNTIILDFKDVDFVSSSGLRVLLSAHKTMERKNGKLNLINVSDDVKNIIDLTGFSDFLHIE